jgi:hypothetical protein
MQFSFVPWIYDQDVIDHTKAMIALRESYANKIVDLARASTETGEPINRPIWWLDPYDETAFEIGDGETILKFRSTYLPYTRHYNPRVIMERVRYINWHCGDVPCSLVVQFIVYAIINPPINHSLFFCLSFNQSQNNLIIKIAELHCDWLKD